MGMHNPVPGSLLTAAMAVIPHTKVTRALETALSLDVPFWPQLPNCRYYEDMYLQDAEHFPGIVLDLDKRTLRFSMDKFAEQLEAALLRFDDPAFFDVSDTYSAMSGYDAIKAKDDLDQFFAKIERPAASICAVMMNNGKDSNLIEQREVRERRKDHAQ